MHTSTALKSSEFEVWMDDKPASLDDVFPDFGEDDRLGIVVRTPGAATGVSVILLAAISAFYDAQRARSDDFFIYPDYFIFHVGRECGVHEELDIWPSHKEVVLPDSPDAILAAINDRGITRLLVEEREPREREVEPHTLASAQHRIVSQLAFAASGRIEGGDVRMTGTSTTEDLVLEAIAQSHFTQAERQEVLDARASGASGQPPSEVYRRISFQDAVTLL